MIVKNLRCNGKRLPLQIDIQKVTFQWNITGCENGTRQSAYELWVGNQNITVWNSGKRESGQCLFVPYEGPQLEPDKRYEWKVRIWNQEGIASGWSETSWFETDIGQDGWQAQWIGFDEPVGKAFQPDKPFYCADDFKCGKNTYYLPPVPYLRKEFSVNPEKRLVSAKLYYTALGVVEIEINGRRIKQGIFAPGFSDYRKTVYTRAGHVEDLLKKGKNSVGIILADGWYAGYMGLNNREWYGSCPRAAAQLHVEYEDGSKEILETDASWKASYGPLLEADIFQGETYDANLELTGWSNTGYDDSNWKPAVTGCEDSPAKVVHPGPPVLEHCHIVPEFIDSKDDKILLRFPEYICGICSFTVKGKKGSRFSVRHAEILGTDGKLHLDGNRSARCMDTYILKGEGVETFRPRFTYHGFRYARITWEGDVKFLSIEGIQIGTQLEEPTVFSCSDVTANAVYRMIRATEKANLVDIPTDCTARDERLGWGMEGNHFMYAMAYLNNQQGPIGKWNHDIWDGQREDGALEAISPAVVMKDIEPYIGDLQSNHGLYMVHALYWMYGDIDIVKRYIEPLKEYFDFLDKNSDRHLRYATSCDWLGILESTGHSDIKHGYGECSPLMIGTAHYAVAVHMMLRLCEAVNDKETQYYRRLYEKIVKAYRINFLERDGMLRRGKQGDYLMALYAGLIPDSVLPKVLEYFRGQLLKSGYVRWFGGTPTTPYLLQTLKKYGMTDLANQFITAVTYPSIGYMHTKGFDTIWERWDAIYEDGRLHPQVMNALSHEGYACVGSYFISGLAGIDALSPGFGKILLEPGVSEEIKWAEAGFHSPYGEIYIKWEYSDGILTLHCKIPANTTGIIKLDGNRKPEFVKGTPAKLRYTDGKTEIDILSGVYGLKTEYTIN